MKFQKMQKAYLVDLDDAVVAVKNAKGKVKLATPGTVNGVPARHLLRVRRASLSGLPGLCARKP